MVGNMLNSGLVRDIAGRCVASLNKGIRVGSNLKAYNSRIAYGKAFASEPRSDSQQDADNLDKLGFAQIRAGNPSLPDLLQTCQTFVRERAETAPRTGKGFFAQLLKPEDLAAHPSLMEVALDPYVIGVISRCYGILPYLESIELLSSFPNTGKLHQSQLWHIDRTDSVVVKQLIYINDVDDDEGPFTLVPCEESRKVPRFAAHYLTDDEIARHADMDKLMVFRGAAGVRALVDTGRCFHFGSRVTKPRHALFAYYNTGYGKYPRLGGWQGSFAEKMNLSETQKQVLDI